MAMASATGMFCEGESSITIMTTPGKLRSIAAAMQRMWRMQHDVWKDEEPGVPLVAAEYAAPNSNVRVKFVVHPDLMQLELSQPPREPDGD